MLFTCSAQCHKVITNVFDVFVSSVAVGTYATHFRRDLGPLSVIGQSLNNRRKKGLRVQRLRSSHKEGRQVRHR